MILTREKLRKEIDIRIDRTKQSMEKRGYDALLVYGDNKVCGSLRYLTNYMPDRAGWISLGPRETYLFEGAALFIPLRSDPVLLLDPGLMPTTEVYAKTVLAGGFSVNKEECLTGVAIANLIKQYNIVSKIGIETWDRFPIPIFLQLRELVLDTPIERSTIVEELRMIKSPVEIEVLRKAAAIGDLGSQTAFRELSSGVGKTELEFVRTVEQIMRYADPIYEDSCTGSPSLINSGTAISGSQLHFPDPKKKLNKGDVVHWDICLRYEGYAVDTSRTRVIGKATDKQKRFYEMSLRMHERVIERAKPGTPACELVTIAEKIAGDAGYELWDRFVGHGLGMDTHERPDMGVEETILSKDMVLAIEPRITDGQYLYGNEDMTLITEEGGAPLNRFEKGPLEVVL